jgi:hypothetical protein
MADQPLDREHDGEHRDDDLDSTDGVESPRPGIAGLREEEPAGHAEHRQDRDLDQEHRSPPEVLQKQPAHQRAQAGAAQEPRSGLDVPHSASSHV